MRVKVCSGSVLFVILFSFGCGGGSSSSGGGTFTPANIQGQYETVAPSNQNSTAVAVIEINFTQTGMNVFAGKQSVVLIQGTQTSTGITLNSLGGECDNGVLGNDSIQATFSSATQLGLTLTEAGSLGTTNITGNANVASDGSQITSGTYNAPAACGFVADSGTFTGTKIQPFSGSYAGMLNNGADAVIVTVSQSGLNLTVSGTDNGTAFTLTGSVVGATFDVVGSISGLQVEDVGIYDHTNNTFLVFNTSLTFLGTLHAGTNPQAIVRSGLIKPRS